MSNDFKKVLLCYDGSEDSKRAVDYICEFARRDIAIVLFGAYDRVQFRPSALASTATTETNSGGWSGEEKKRRQKIATTRLGDARNILVNKCGFNAKQLRTVVVETADVRDAVLDTIASNRIDCVVVGSRGHSAIKQTMLGSMSIYLTQNAPCPVVIARGPT